MASVHCAYAHSCFIWEHSGPVSLAHSIAPRAQDSQSIQDLEAIFVYSVSVHAHIPVYSV